MTYSRNDVERFAEEMFGVRLLSYQKKIIEWLLDNPAQYISFARGCGKTFIAKFMCKWYECVESEITPTTAPCALDYDTLMRYKNEPNTGLSNNDLIDHYIHKTGDKNEKRYFFY